MSEKKITDWVYSGLHPNHTLFHPVCTTDQESKTWAELIEWAEKHDSLHTLKLQVEELQRRGYRVVATKIEVTP